MVDILVVILVDTEVFLVTEEDSWTLFLDEKIQIFTVSLVVQNKVKFDPNTLRFISSFGVIAYKGVYTYTYRGRHIFTERNFFIFCETKKKHSAGH